MKNKTGFNSIFIFENGVFSWIQFHGTIGASGLTEKFKLTFFKFELSSGETPKLGGGQVSYFQELCVRPRTRLMGFWGDFYKM